ncbi:MAG: zf-TFIIB domain-containing protein [Firmicutes bacterium]|nr:zf-TFIIB domain-containing protein [[Eubacterium] siraeum]MCM1486856.1 zf-TFIIB domain-containing protein [Bacillota bacterium]
MAQIPFTTNGKCPNCGKKISDYNPNSYLYGSPIKYCKKCKGAYVDTTYHEIAVDGFPKEEMKTSTGLKSALFGLAVFVICGGIFVAEIMFTDGYYRVFPVMAVVGFIAMIAGIVDAIRVKSGAKAGSMEKLRQESIQRLNDVQYAMQLRELGYNVPPQYLPQGYQQPIPQGFIQGAQQGMQQLDPSQPFPQGFAQGAQQGVQQLDQPQPVPQYQQPIPAPQEPVLQAQQPETADVNSDNNNIQQ